jgi:hypothetical protein
VDINVGDPVIPAPLRTAIPVLLGDAPIEVLAYPKVMVVTEKLVTALQRGRASTRWRDFADLFMLLPGDLVEPEIIEALRTVAEHRGVPLRPLGEVLEGMPQELAGTLGGVARAPGRAGPGTRKFRDGFGHAR